MEYIGNEIPVEDKLQEETIVDGPGAGKHAHCQKHNFPVILKENQLKLSKGKS